MSVTYRATVSLPHGPSGWTRDFTKAEPYSDLTSTATLLDAAECVQALTFPVESGIVVTDLRPVA